MQPQLDWRQPGHVARGNFGPDIWNELPDAHHVHQGWRQEEVLLRLDQQQEAQFAHRLRQVERGQRASGRGLDRLTLSDAQQLPSGPLLCSAAARLLAVRYGWVAS